MVAIAGRIALPNAKRIVVKVGSALLVDEDKNTINKAWLAGIARDISRLKTAEKDVVVVSSGAIALGSRLLKIHNKALSLQEKQAAAATGQVTLAHAWMEALRAFKVQAAQILLSPDDTETRRKHLNARATMGALLDLGAEPVVNENDTVATAEIRFGDNDRLAARVAAPSMSRRPSAARMAAWRPGSTRRALVTAAGAAGAARGCASRTRRRSKSLRELPGQLAAQFLHFFN